MALEAINIEAGQAKTRSLRGTDRVYRLIELSLLKLSPRLRQTLAYLLEGDSEKQVAARLDLSHATIHQYVTPCIAISASGAELSLWPMS